MSQKYDARGATMIEMIAILSAVLVIGIFLVRTFIAFRDFRQADRRIALMYALQEGMKIPDAYADVAGKLYSTARIQATLNNRLGRTASALAVNIPGSVPLMGMVADCNLTATYTCNVLATSCIPGGCTAGNTTALLTAIRDYSKDMSAAQDFVGATGASGTIQIEAQAALNSATGDVLEDATAFCIGVKGDVRPTIRSSPSPRG